MTGWRLGYLAGPKHFVAACGKIQSQVYRFLASEHPSFLLVNCCYKRKRARDTYLIYLRFFLLQYYCVILDTFDRDFKKFKQN